MAPFSPFLSSRPFDSAASGRLPKTLALVGLMGAGKTAIGRRLATRLQLAFIDADHEIEQAAGCTISEYFEHHGEAAFRAGERRVIRRLMDNPTHILATGGGAFIDTDTRQLLRERSITLWLRAELDLLVARTARRNTRPLLREGDPREILQRLMSIRYPIYAEADVIVESEDVSPEETVERVLLSLEDFLGYRLATVPGPAVGMASSFRSATGCVVR
jgi:shikimate kinase